MRRVSELKFSGGGRNAGCRIVPTSIFTRKKPVHELGKKKRFHCATGVRKKDQRTEEVRVGKKGDARLSVFSAKKKGRGRLDGGHGRENGWRGRWWGGR